MREISLVQGNDSSEELKKVTEALVKAINKPSPPPVAIPAPKVQVTVPQNKTSYLVEVNRDRSGKVQTMLVRPYEPI